MTNPVVEIADGKLRGTITKNYEGDIVYTFLGIPYGKPPVGELRFMSPQPVEPWKGVRDAIADGNPCFQKDLLENGEFVGSEDCLYLNVFTKNFSDTQNLKPVLVYIHGGGFTIDSSDSKRHSPAFLMMEDIVFVCINYRLGVLGFLSLDDTSLNVPGNAGLKDQVLALKWVQKNIDKFGGDPNNVTISGESAGSVSINHHMLLPSSKGLFHKAIMLSGTVFNPWPHLSPKYRDIIKYLGKDYRSDKEFLEILKTVSVRELLEAQHKWAVNDLEDSTFRQFAPCVEKPNDTAFLKRKPIDVITSGDYHKVPMIIGYNSNEGLFSVGFPEEVEKLTADQLVPAQIVLPDDEDKKKNLLEKIQKLYKSDKYSKNIYLANGDSMIIAGTVALARHFAQTSSHPIYFQVFDLVASRNFLRHIFNLGDQYIGACHADELGYIFDNQMFHGTPIVPGSTEDIAIRRFVKLWGNFTKYGNPTPDKEEFKLTWTPITTDTLYYLHFGKELSVKTNPDDDRMKLWKEIYNSHDDTKNFLP